MKLNQKKVLVHKVMRLNLEGISESHACEIANVDFGDYMEWITSLETLIKIKSHYEAQKVSIAEHGLFRLGIGYEYEEKQISKKALINRKTNKAVATEINEKTIRKRTIGNAHALLAYLAVKDPDTWQMDNLDSGSLLDAIELLRLDNERADGSNNIMAAPPSEEEAITEIAVVNQERKQIKEK